MKMILVAALLLLLLLFSGCISLDEQNQFLRTQQLEAENISAKQICDAKLIELSPYLEAIDGKVIRGKDENISSEMLSNNTYPTDSEKLALLKFEEWREFCIRNQHAVLRKFFNPEYMVIATDVMNAWKISIHELYSGKITYGDYNKNRLSLASYLAGEFSKLDAKFQEISRQQKIYQQQMQMQQSFNMLNSGLRMMQPPQQYAPSNVTCSQNGMYTNCTRW